MIIGMRVPDVTRGIHIGLLAAATSTDGRAPSATTAAGFSATVMARDDVADAAARQRHQARSQAGSAGIDISPSMEPHQGCRPPSATHPATRADRKGRRTSINVANRKADRERNPRTVEHAWNRCRGPSRVGAEPIEAADGARVRLGGRESARRIDGPEIGGAKIANQDQ